MRTIIESSTCATRAAASSQKPLTGLGRHRSIPVLHVRGSHYEVGYDTGRVFGSVIKNFVATYANLRDFEREYKTDAGRAAYEKTLANMKKRFPQYVKEIQGYSDGSGVPFYQLFLLHMDDIIEHVNDNDNHISRNDTGGCSTVAINLPGQSILGHTEDAFHETLNHFYILSAHIIPDAEDAAAGAIEEKFASVCYAGSLPGYTSGNNYHGLVFSINTLSVLRLKPGHTPRTFITRAMLAARNYEETKQILLDEGLGIGNGFSVNLFWTEYGKRTLCNVEVAPDPAGPRSILNIHKYENETLVHCNTYQRLKVKEVIGPIIDSSKARLQAIHGQKSLKTREDIQIALSDKSGADFPVFQDKSDMIIMTIVASIFDLNTGTWSVYIDPPSTSKPVAVLPLTFQVDQQ